MKEAPGALRDLSATRTIALLTDPLLLRKGPTEPARFDDAEDFLLRVRSILHLEAGRNQNVLGHELQERTAELMGYPGADAHQRVERLMSDYFRHARIVSRSLGWARRTAPLPVGPNLGLSRDGIRFMDPIQAARNPASWMGAFEAAVEHHTSVSEEALSCIQQHVDRYRADDFFPEAERSRRAGRSSSSRRAGSTTASARCTTAACSGACSPSSRRSRGGWCATSTTSTRWTSTRCSRSATSNGSPATSSPAASASRTCWPDCCTPSCWCCRCCCTTSASGATTTMRSRASAWPRARLTRLQITGEARDTVLFLIRHHIRMSLVAFRRDTEDPDVVKEFADFVGTEDRLKMLCLITLADVGAVSPDTLTPWKEELLWRLYVDTYNHLTQRYGDERIGRNQAGLDRLTAQLPADVTKPELERFVEGLPQRYLQLFRAGRHLPARAAGPQHPARRGARLARSRGRVGVVARRRHARQAEALLQHLRRALVVRDEHPPRQRADQSQRPGARRLPFHRRRAASSR